MIDRKDVMKFVITDECNMETKETMIIPCNNDD